MSSSGQDPFSREYNPFAAPQTNDYAMPGGSGDPNQAQLARRLLRLAAQILDGILLLPGLLIVAFTMTSTFSAAARAGQLPFADQMMNSVIIVIATLALYLILNGYLLTNRGQTIGKLAAGIRIVDFQTGEKVSFGRIFGLRFFPMQLISAIPILGGLIGFVDILMIFRSSRRCLHDEIAGTKVILAS